jgi:hypothetical protein
MDSFSRLTAAPPHGIMAHSLRSVRSAAVKIALVISNSAPAVYVQIKALNPLAQPPLPYPPIQQCLSVHWAGPVPASATSPSD